MIVFNINSKNINHAINLKALWVLRMKAYLSLHLSNTQNQYVIHKVLIWLVNDVSYSDKL
jgi:hypothetical protein